MNHAQSIREIARRWLAEGLIDLFLGYQTGPEEGNHVPHIVTGPGQIDHLVFGPKSVFNLTNYLKFEHARHKRIGIVVKGCDSRALNLLLTEHQVKRENLRILGICCEGVVDEQGKKFGNCEECVSPNPVVYDELLGSPQETRTWRPNEEVTGIMARSAVERGEFFQKVFESCIRCNACRNSCPLCSCARCSVEENSSHTCDQANTPANAAAALLTWSLHLAGRCVDCRNCERACPMGLPIHLLHKRNEMVVYENFGQHLAGMKEQDPGALVQYDLKDPDSFIM